MSDPRGGQERIAGYDVARAIAICAMILENFKVVMLGSSQEHQLLVWLAGRINGRSAPLFVLLAGLGISILSAGARASSDPGQMRQARRVLLRRAAFLFALGCAFINAWWMDILHFYGVYIALAALLFLKASGRALLAAAGACVAAATLLLVARGDAYYDDVEFFSLLGMPRDVFLDGIHPVLPWLAFVLVGMWVGRLDLCETSLRRRVLGASFVVAVATEIASAALCAANYSGTLRLLAEGTPDVLGTRLTPPGPLYVLSASATSIVAICLSVEAAQRFPRSLLVTSLAAAGRMSLTLYLAHALVGAGLLWVLGALEEHSILFVLGYWACYYGASVLVAVLVLRRFRNGPLEWLLRRVSGRIAPAGDMCSGARQATARDPRLGIAAALGVLGIAAIAYGQVFGVARPSLTCAEGSGELRPSSAVVDQLSLACSRRTFDLVLDQRTAVVLRASSSFDNYIEVREAASGELIAQDDDSGPGRNARLATTLPPGRHRVIVRPYSVGTGFFSLRMDRAAP